MKKYVLLFVSLLTAPHIFSQDISDALRYSQNEIQGTARFRALSGAFGALGSDMSAISINPAGSAVFNSSHASFSISSLNNENETSYFNGANLSTNSSFDIHQAGAVFVFKNGDENSQWEKFTIGLAYDKQGNYEDDWFASGTNSTSIDRYFLDITEAQEIPFGILKLLPGEYIEDAYADIGAVYGYDYQQVFLGYWAGVIDPLNLDNDTNDDNIDYISNTAPATSFEQEFGYAATGYNGKFTFNFAAQHNDNLYLGVNLNSHFINYDKYTVFYEENSNVDALVSNVLFENRLSTIGYGFSLQLGGIAKLSENFRVGLSYDSPTWLTIEEELIQNIDSNIADPDIGFISSIINIFPKYKIQTPAKLTGSIAYVFGEKGLISFDYSQKDYSNTKFKPTSDAYFSSLNNQISNNLTSAATYRIGGELKHKQFSFRGGYRLEESPYKNKSTIDDLTGYSLGLGYNFGNTKLDLTFDQSKITSDYQLFSTGLTDNATIDNINTNVTLSLSFNL